MPRAISAATDRMGITAAASASLVRMKESIRRSVAGGAPRIRAVRDQPTMSIGQTSCPTTRAKSAILVQKNPSRSRKRSLIEPPDDPQQSRDDLEESGESSEFPRRARLGRRIVHLLVDLAHLANCRDDTELEDQRGLAAKCVARLSPLPETRDRHRCVAKSAREWQTTLSRGER
jgi:hypothetical protein